MAADIELAPGQFWSTTAGRLGYIIERMATAVDDAEVVAALRLVDEANLGVVVLGNFSTDVRRQLLTYLADDLVRDAAAAPIPGAQWDSMLASLANLADHARGVLAAEGTED